MNESKIENNVLSVKYPEIAKWWDYDKNDDLTPDNVTCGSQIKINWKCNQEHKYERDIKKRIKHDYCPECRSIENIKKSRFAFKYPELLKEWDYSKNKDIDPKEITPSTKVSVWWKCKNNHEWKSLISKRIYVKDCPECNPKNYLIDYPDLIKELHPTKNKDVNITLIKRASRKVLWWKCNKGHEWEKEVSGRTRGNKCPFCFGKYVSPDNCLSRTHPEIAKEWNYEKNGDLKPEEVTFGSSKNVWWNCSNGHSYQSRISTRTLDKSNCVKCYYFNEENALSKTHPELLKEWDYDKNKGLDPNEFTSGSCKKVFWNCKNGHTYPMIINKRTFRGDSCPKCSTNGYSQKAIKWLEQLSKEKDIYIQHAENDGEFIIKINNKKTRVDGYCKETNTVFSFSGCWFHGCIINGCKNMKYFKKNNININVLSKKTFRDLHDATIEREKKIKKLGYNLVTIWECEFDAQK